jgi:hypothetical protein
LDDWEWDEQLHTAQRLVASCAVAGISTASARPATLAAQWRDPDVLSRPPAAALPPPPALLARFIFSVGLVMFAFGGALLVWSFIAGRGDLWTCGLPLTLGGQMLLFVGIVLQLDGFRQCQRVAAETLGAMEEELQSLRQATSVMGSSHTTAAQSYHPHLAAGANPQLLLTDLKRQMDLLTLRLAQERRAA